MNVLFSFYFGMGLHAVSFFKQLILLYLCHSAYLTLCSRKWKINTQKALHEVRIKENRCLTKIHVMWNSIMITSYCMVSKNHRLLDQVTHISLIHSFFSAWRSWAVKRLNLSKAMEHLSLKLISLLSDLLWPVDAYACSNMLTFEFFIASYCITLKIP